MTAAQLDPKPSRMTTDEKNLLANCIAAVHAVGHLAFVDPSIHTAVTLIDEMSEELEENGVMRIVRFRKLVRSGVDQLTATRKVYTPDRATTNRQMVLWTSSMH
jgi:hypothetical protein